MLTKEQKITRWVQKIIDLACELGREEKDTMKNKLILDEYIYKLIRGEEIKNLVLTPFL